MLAVRKFATAFAVFVASFVLSGLGAVQPAVAAADFVVESLDYDFPEEVKDAADEGKNVVIMFHQNGCPYCDKMRRRVFPHPAVNTQYSEKFVLIEVNIKGDLDVITHDGETMTEKDYAEKMHVRATPVIMFLSKDSTEALKLTGYQDPQMFMTAGRYVSSDAFKDGTTFINFVRAGR